MRAVPTLIRACSGVRKKHPSTYSFFSLPPHYQLQLFQSNMAVAASQSKKTREVDPEIALAAEIATNETNQTTIPDKKEAELSKVMLAQKEAELDAAISAMVEDGFSDEIHEDELFALCDKNSPSS